MKNCCFICLFLKGKMKEPHSKLWGPSRSLERRVFINGIDILECNEFVTHTTMYTGWPKGWAVLKLAKEVYEG